MQTKFKDIAQYYLGTGLNIRHNDGDNLIMNATGSGSNFISIDDIEEYGKPLLRSLDSLTKPITVKWYNDGNSFVPLDELNKVLGYTEVSIVNFVNSGLGYRINDGAQTALSFRDDVLPILSLLLKWHFNIFGLEETEYIKID